MAAYAEVVQCDVCIIGGGTMGSAAAHYIATPPPPAAGTPSSSSCPSVVVLEAYSLGHQQASNGGASRIYRKTDTDVHVAAMAQAALPLFKQLEAEGGRQLLTTSGCALSEKGMLRVTMRVRCVRCAAGCERYTYT